ncbi:MAG: hypothetical protein ABW061_23930 [Polyangiaceae bacterium]
MSNVRVGWRWVLGTSLWFTSTGAAAAEPSVWVQHGAAILASDTAEGDQFGSRLAISGDTAIVGAYNKNTTQGAAYVFVRLGTTWVQQGPPLVARDGHSYEQFGTSVAISGDTAIVGAQYKTLAQDPLGVQSGAAYVFVRTGTTWTQQGPPLVPVPNPGPSGGAGHSVAIDGDTAVVSSWHNTAVFVRSAGIWTQQGPALAVFDEAIEDGEPVALSGNTLLVGLPGASDSTDTSHTRSGEAYIYVRSGTTWAQQGPKLVAPAPAKNAFFGCSVALSGDTALIGVSGQMGGGAAHVFVRSNETWVEQGPMLTASSASAPHDFGFSVSVSGDTALIGAPDLSNEGYSAGYVFQRAGGVWTQQGQALVPNDLAKKDRIGLGVALSDSTALVGAPGKKVITQGQGVFYNFGLVGPLGAACATATDCASNYCADGVCCSGPCQGACEACSVASGATTDGQCAPVSSGSSACLPLVCDGVSASCVSCANDDQCPAGRYCGANGQCQAQQPQGASCDATPGNQCLASNCRVCATGFCTDGVCCESACQGTCQACSALMSGVADGSCAPVLADQDPHGDCSVDLGYPASCQADGACDGNGECRLYAKSGTACGATHCTAGQVSGAICDGAGKCDQATVSCAPYACDSSACASSCTDDDDCEASAYCVNGTCQLRKPAGQACASSHQCSSGFCTDGVCCESACEGQCQACGKGGKCSPVKGAPRGERPACAGVPKECGGSCDGTTVDACEYEGANAACGSECSNAHETRRACDGNGACVAQRSTPCPDGFACGNTNCLSACATDDDCARGYRCHDSACANAPSPPDTPPDQAPDTPAEPTPDTPAADVSSSACGCRMPREQAPSPSLVLLLAIPPLAIARPRRRRAREARSRPN